MVSIMRQVSIRGQVSIMRQIQAKLLVCLSLFFALSGQAAVQSKGTRAELATAKTESWNSRFALPTAEALNSFITPKINGKEGTLILAFTDGKHHVFRTYGSVTSPAGTSDQNTLFEIASITKVFTSLVMVDLWKDNKLSFDDPVEKYLPQDVVVPKQNGKSITLFQLSTHSSGLPRDPDNLDQYVKYGKPEFHEFLARCKLESNPGTKYSYSNAGYRLLGEALEFALQESYEPALIKRILTPLHLDDTRIVLPEDKIPRLAQGRSEDGKKVPNAPTSGGPGGGLKSSAEDMLRFLDACIEPVNETPGSIRASECIAESCKHRFRINSNESSCLGWLRNNKQDSYNKYGLMHGFSTCIEFSPKDRIGIAVLSSTAQIDAEALLKELRKRLLRRA